jgi:hypothetical protein
MGISKKSSNIRIIDMKEPKMKFFNSNRSSYFHLHRSTGKNDLYQRGKVVTSRILGKNKSTAKLLTDTSSQGKNLKTLRTFSPSLEKIEAKLY